MWEVQTKEIAGNEPTKGNAENRSSHFCLLSKPAKIIGIIIDTLDWATLSKGATNVAKSKE